MVNPQNLTGDGTASAFCNFFFLLWLDLKSDSLKSVLKDFAESHVWIFLMYELIPLEKKP